MCENTMFTFRRCRMHGFATRGRNRSFKRLERTAAKEILAQVTIEIHTVPGTKQRPRTSLYCAPSWTTRVRMAIVIGQMAAARNTCTSLTSLTDQPATCTAVLTLTGANGPAGGRPGHAQLLRARGVQPHPLGFFRQAPGRVRRRRICSQELT